MKLTFENLVLVKTTFQCPRAAHNEFPTSVTFNGQLRILTMKASKVVLVVVLVSMNALY